MIFNPLTGQAQDSAEPAIGIPRDFARARAANYGDIRYQLGFELVPGAETIAGQVRISLRVKAAGQPLVLDFKGLTEAEINGRVHKLEVNNSSVAGWRQVNGHIVIPASALREGENSIEVGFDSPVRKSGSAITRYLDSDDKSEYIYTLFVPSDAHMIFPCFDQPDLKARFTLEVTAPADWKVVANTLPAGEPQTVKGDQRRIRFHETRPLSTYLFAFAAGPFIEMPVSAATALGEQVPMRIFARRSKTEKLRAELNELARINREGVRALADYFDYRYPFGKYDMVLLPEFAYGGMEHAGASFFREERLLFPTTPTPNDLQGRAELILHEAAHQWFGDLVTMRWFDDLWLKEGFATFMAYRAMETVMPQYDVWKAFHLKNKPRAYLTDVTKGTTPIFQEIPNLKDAKSAYGNIVYTKAPSLLRQLEFFIGAEVFRTGVRRFLKRHEFANAEWSDLIRSYEESAGRSLTVWANAWVKRRGLPAVNVNWNADANGRLERVALTQRDMLGEGGQWPLKTQVSLYYDGRAPEVFTVTLEGAVTEVAGAVGKPRPDFVFANHEDYGYGIFLLDERSLDAVRARLDKVSNEFLRALLWGALWDAVREAELAPVSYLELVVASLAAERDPITAQLILSNSALAFSRYLSAEQQAALAPRLEAVVFDRLMNEKDDGLRATYFRAAPTLVSSVAGRDKLKKILAGELVIPGITLKPRDRWDIVTALLALGDGEGDKLLAAERQRDSSDDGRRYAFVAAAARADRANKQDYFQRYLNDREVAENWIETSLRAFNSIRQAEMTLPYLKPALEALPALKRQRKIFFINEWLDAFISGQRSEEAVATVKEFLKEGKLERDLQLKVLEALDRLERSVRIRARYAR